MPLVASTTRLPGALPVDAGRSEEGDPVDQRAAQVATWPTAEARSAIRSASQATAARPTMTTTSRTSSDRTCGRA